MTLVLGGILYLIAGLVVAVLGKNEIGRKADDAAIVVFLWPAFAVLWVVFWVLEKAGYR